MALQDFIKKLQETDDSDVIYSKPPEDTTKIIPPDKPDTIVELHPVTGTKVIPPTTPEEKPTIKFKINISNSSKVVETPVEIKQPPQVIKQPPKPVMQPAKYDVDILFERSETDPSKKNIWLDYYEKAKTSKKQNSIVERMKLGKFAITQDNQVLILPDYDMYNKSTSDILKDKWLKN